MLGEKLFEAVSEAVGAGLGGTYQLGPEDREDNELLAEQEEQADSAPSNSTDDPDEL